MLLNQIKLLQDLSWQEINPRLYSIAVCLLVVRVRCLWDVGAQCDVAGVTSRNVGVELALMNEWC
jgi:hypothetical protein